MDVPGSIGYPIIGDESIEFARFPHDFIERRCKSYGAVFQGRILNKSHVFLTSNRATQDLLNVKWLNFRVGYKDYMSGLFDDNLVFLDDDAWSEDRAALEHVFNRESIACSTEQTKHVIEDFVANLSTGTPVVVYDAFKELATRLSIALFLSHDMGQEDAKSVSELMTTHWRGMMSVPLPFTIPGLWRSGYSKALEAKEKLSMIISEKLQSTPSNIASGVRSRFPANDHTAAVGHLMVFVSALIPKAMSSLLTSTLLELAKPENAQWREACRSDDHKLDDVILEVQRLYPPFMGGRRVCTEACEVAGYSIAKDQAVVFISFTANRDSAVFPEANRFRPERWSNENAGDRSKVCTFGGGPRECIGKVLATVLLRSCIKEVLQRFSFELEGDQELVYKTLPVLRPKHDVTAVFTKSQGTPHNNS